VLDQQLQSTAAQRCRKGHKTHGNKQQVNFEVKPRSTAGNSRKNKVAQSSRSTGREAMVKMV
jgi:hypothetical protein